MPLWSSRVPCEDFLCESKGGTETQHGPEMALRFLGCNLE